MQLTVKRPKWQIVKTWGELVYAKVEKCSSAPVQIKDSGLTEGVDDKTSPLLAVKVSLRVHSKK